jgi:hypothetical protein
MLVKMCHVIIANSSKKTDRRNTAEVPAFNLTRTFIPKAAKSNQYAAAGLLTCFASCGLPVPKNSGGRCRGF